MQISTDKAVRPSSVMGASKRVAEQAVLAHAPKGAAYSTVRFGNVLGSRGSVIPTFARQIANGGPVTVTDARMTRFFMSVEEAVQLVLQSSMLSHGGEIFMLEMGVPVRILDLAERMIRLSGCQVGIDIPIEIVGIRPGEKLAEVLSMPDENRSSRPVYFRTSTGCCRSRPPSTPVRRRVLEELEQATARRDQPRPCGRSCSARAPSRAPRSGPIRWTSRRRCRIGEAAFDWPEPIDGADRRPELQEQRWPATSSGRRTPPADQVSA